eukprot:gene7662-8498_t
MMLAIYFAINLFFFTIQIPSTESEHTLADVFKVSDNEESCKLNGDKFNCERQSNGPVFGPKFQKVHLQLPRVNPVKTGYERRVRLVNDKKHTMKTLAIYPPVFEIKNFLTEDECDAMIHLAKMKGMKNATVATRNVGISPENSHIAFDQWDQDMDGSLSRKEISEISEIKHLLLSEDDVERMERYLDMDKDKNGKISYGELESVTFEKFSKYMQDLSKEQTFSSAYNIEQTSLWHDEDELLVYEDVFQDYHQRLSNLTRIPKKLIEESEPIQIKLFKNGSHTHCSHDSDQSYPNIPCCIYGSTTRCRKCRFASIMYFLNDVKNGGELVFPLADNKTFSWKDLHNDTAKACSKSPNASLSTLRIRPEKGKAILWYNHYIGRDTGWIYTLDPLSLNGATRLDDGEKWIASTWVNIIGDGVNELRPWKMGNNVLSWNNLRKDIIKEMRNDDFIEGQPYLHDSKLTIIEDEVTESDHDSTGKSVGEDKLTGEEKERVHEKIQPANNNEAVWMKKPSKQDVVLKNRKDEIKHDKKADKEPSINETKIVDIIDVNIKMDQKIAVNEAKPVGEEVERIENKVKHAKNKVVRIKHDKDNLMPLEKKINDKDKQYKKGRIETKVRKEMVMENMSSKLEMKTDQPEAEVSNKKSVSPDDESPSGPPTRISYPHDLKRGKIIENKLVAAVLMLVEELTRDELEMIARSLHDKLQLACIPIMVNPFGPMG